MVLKMKDNAAVNASPVSPNSGTCTTSTPTAKKINMPKLARNGKAARRHKRGDANHPYKKMPVTPIPNVAMTRSSPTICRVRPSFGMSGNEAVINIAPRSCRPTASSTRTTA